MEPGKLRRIAVIGAGAAGRDMTLRCMRAGFDVVLEDVMPSKLRGVEQDIDSGQFAGTLSVVTTVEDAVREADLAIDFVPDELESKLEIFSMLDRMAPPRTILCTPTTALSIADLAACTYRPQLCFALRGLDSASAELVSTSRSAPQAAESVQQWLRSIGFAVESCSDPAEVR